MMARLKESGEGFNVLRGQLNGCPEPALRFVRGFVCVFMCVCVRA